MKKRTMSWCAAGLALLSVLSACGGSGSGGPATLTASNNATQVGDGTVHFSSTGENLTGATLEWNFGDGTTATGANVDHVYGRADDYTVQVTARNSSGNEVAHATTAAVIRFTDFVAGRDCLGDTSWCWQSPLIVDKLYEPYFIDALEGWLPGESGLLAHTTDSGRSWARVPTDDVNTVLSVRFSDRLHGLASLSSGKLLRTTDAGTTWQYLVPTVRAPLSNSPTIIAYDGQRIVLDNAIVSHDAGATWELIGLRAVTRVLGEDCIYEEGLDHRLRKIAGCTGTSVTDVSPPTTLAHNRHATSFPSPVHGFTLAQTYKNYPTLVEVGEETLDGGATWSTFPPTGLETVPVTGLTMTSESAGWAWVDHPSQGLYHTADGARHWTQVQLPAGLTDAANAYEKFVAETADRAWISVDNLIGLTRDAGATWKVVTVTAETHSTPSNILQWSDDDKSIVVRFGDRVHASTDGGATWTRVLGGDPRDSGMQASTNILFKDAMHGLMTVNDGGVKRTSDGGRTWTRTTFDVDYHYPDASLELQSTGGSGLRMLREQQVYESADFGETWKRTVTPHSLVSAVEAMSWPDAMHGWVLPAYMNLHRTTDGGAHWTEVNGPWTTSIETFAFTSPTQGVVIAKPVWDTDTYFAWRTEDGGATWIRLPNSDLGELHASGRFIVGFMYRAFSFSADGGKTWSEVRTARIPTSASFSDDKHGMVLAGGQVLSTTDGGLHWTPQSMGSADIANSIFQLDPYTAWIGARNGEVLTTVAGGNLDAKRQ